MFNLFIFYYKLIQSTLIKNVIFRIHFMVSVSVFWKKFIPTKFLYVHNAFLRVDNKGKILLNFLFEYF